MYAIEWDLSELDSFAKNLGNISKYEKYIQKAAKELAENLRLRIKAKTPLGETGKLKAGWDSQRGLHVKKVAEGFEVQLVNPVEYATWVNDGHRVYNQFGGPYQVKKRAKVPVSARWQKGTSNWFVFGHFFVEQAILTVKEDDIAERMIAEQLDKWLAWCCR